MIVLMVNEIRAIDDDLGFLEEESRSISYSSVELMMFAILFEQVLGCLQCTLLHLLILVSLGAFLFCDREYEVSSVRYYVRDTFSVPLESVCECKLVCKKHFIRQLHRLYDKYGNNDDIAATEEVDLDDIAVAVGAVESVSEMKLRLMLHLDVEIVRVTEGDSIGGDVDTAAQFKNEISENQISDVDMRNSVGRRTMDWGGSD
ncbi:hypothetical protein C5167_022523 [Papaver somniferum]|uniref:Uncharacterized protein n=1 Tax=Papaver somniferum TaxID=3469 RepID=A0A4Y7JI76_PAPSO|nr:hypothetical protein C5167_022523 [Papaver somniferum]